MLASTLLPPPPDLADVVESVWDVDVPDAAFARTLDCTILPSASAVMVVHYRSPISSDRRRFEGRPYRSVVTGVQREVVRLRLSGDTGSMVVRFRPDGAARLFGATMAAFADANVELADAVGVTGVSLLQERLAEAGGAAQRMTAMVEFLRGRLRPEGFDAPLQLAVRLLRCRPGTPVGTIARRLEMSERHLARCFAGTVGVPPKQFARLVRAERIVASRWRGHGWAQTAAACGYVDQAHMVNDFRALTGLSPNAYLRAIAGPAWRETNARLAMSGFCNTAIL